MRLPRLLRAIFRASKGPGQQVSSSDWYEALAASDNTVMQCDVLTGIQVHKVASNAVLTHAAPKIAAKVTLVDALILTQTCDLEKDAVKMVLLAELTPWSKFAAGIPDSDALRIKQMEVRRGYSMHLTLLQEREHAPALPWSVVNFRHLYTVPKNLVLDHVATEGQRLRLTPPHREFVSQAFARYFMRVAVEDDLGRFDEAHLPT